MGLTDKLVQYDEWCQQFADDPQHYFRYVHGHFIPLIEQERVDGKLKQGKKKQQLIDLTVTSVVEIEGSDYKYQGEVDIDNKPHGFGVASDTSYNTLTEK